jgi:FixJ family two-component response regulator
MISVIDDDESVRLATQTLLRSAEYESSVFASADDFLNSGTLARTECLILDIRMPGMSGPELQSRLIADGWRIPTIFISAYDDPLVRQQVMQAGAVEFLNKPYDGERLLATVEVARARALTRATQPQ